MNLLVFGGKPQKGTVEIFGLNLITYSWQINGRAPVDFCGLFNVLFHAHKQQPELFTESFSVEQL